jgi:predicted AlkP superfamily pyrophosphatase or phosphodiesterase
MSVRLYKVPGTKTRTDTCSLPAVTRHILAGLVTCQTSPTLKFLSEDLASDLSSSCHL